MMRFLTTLLFLLFAVYIFYPYLNLYRLNNALLSPENSQLVPLLDMSAIQAHYRAEAPIKAAKLTNAGTNDNHLITEAIHSVSQATVNELTKIEPEWVKSCLQQRSQGSIINSLDFAFFESPTRFITRIGSFGEKPVFIQMNLQDWRWRVTALYDCNR